MKPIIQEDFFKWVVGKETWAGENIARMYETPLKESIKQLNWQMKKFEEAAKKMSNILNEPYGKALIMYMKETDPQFAEMLRRKMEEETQP
jgi:hypothetical protein